MANGVRHPEKNSSYTKNFKIKLGSSHKVIFFYFEKSSMINKLTHKIKTVFFPNSIHSSLNMTMSLIIKQNFSNIFTYLARAWWVEQIDIWRDFFSIRPFFGFVWVKMALRI